MAPITDPLPSHRSPGRADPVGSVAVAAWSAQPHARGRVLWLSYCSLIRRGWCLINISEVRPQVSIRF